MTGLSNLAARVFGVNNNENVGDGSSSRADKIVKNLSKSKKSKYIKKLSKIRHLE